jgi:DNA-binding CsgD family transcriptional regulator
MCRSGSIVINQYFLIMNREIDKLYEEYFELNKLIKFDVREQDYKILDYHIPLLHRLDVVDTSIISIFDLYQKKHIYLSRQFETVFGQDLEKAAEEVSSRYADSFIHPDDFVEMLRAGNFYMRLMLSLPSGKSKHYKVVRDYRMMHKDGKYVRVIEQLANLELDRVGNPWLGLCILDLSPDSNIDAPFSSHAIDLETGDVFHFPPLKEDANEKPSLTRREKEILGLIARGLISKEIADKLFISVNTVNTHRQRILEKLDAGNSMEAIKYASNLGLIGKERD